MAENVIVAVGGEKGAPSRATIVDSPPSAERLVEALIKAGCPGDAVGVFSCDEVSLEVSYKATARIQGTSMGHSFPFHAIESEVVVVMAEDAAYAQPTELELAPALVVHEVAGGGTDVPPAGPALHLRIRADRVVWASLWTLSVLILGASLLISLSKPAPREFTPVAPSSEAHGSIGPSKVLDSAAAPNDVAAGVAECRLGSGECRCADFGSQAEAQAYYARLPGDAGHNVDPDGDEVFCEWLLGSTSGHAP